MARGADNLKLAREEIMGRMKVALGSAPADLAVTNGKVLNVYTGELLEGEAVLVKGDRIAYVGRNPRSIAPTTRVVDAGGRTVVPGFIDGHTHADYPYGLSEMIPYAMRGGTTTIVTEAGEMVYPLGYEGVLEFWRSARNQPIKFFITAPPQVTISPAARKSALTVPELHKLLRRKGFIGLGEPYWAQVVDGDERVLELISETVKAGKRVEGHSSGARDAKLQAYVASGIFSCHEPITADEVLERMRLGVCVLTREGEVRRELEAVAPLAQKKIDFRMLGLSSDGLGPWQLMKCGYMDFIVQKAINLGFDPVVAIQAATINIAQHLAMDDLLGGIAPGRYADMVIIPDLRTIRPECVISNGRVVVEEGKVVVPPRQHRYSLWAQKSVPLPRRFTPQDFAIPVKGGRPPVKVRVMDMVTDLVCREAIMDLPVVRGELQIDTAQDLVKVAAIDRGNMPGQTFTALIRGLKIKKGAVALTLVWDSSDLIVAGASEADMAGAVNRLREMQGGMVVVEDGKVLAEFAAPVGGWISTAPMPVIAEQLTAIQKASEGLGFPYHDVRLTLSVMTTPAIAFLRITESGLFDIKQNKLVPLVVG